MTDETTGDVVHMAGIDVTLDGHLLRQRCAWCGAVLIDVDLALTARPTADTDQRYPTWEIGALVAITGSLEGGFRAGHVVEQEEGEKIPENACANLDETITR